MLKQRRFLNFFENLMIRLRTLLTIWSLISLIGACGGHGGNATVASPTSYTVSTTVRGLSTGNTLVISNNGSDSLTFTTNTSLNFPTVVANGATYSVAITTQPTGQICFITNGSGTSSANVSVSISCQVGYAMGPLATDIYGNTTGGALGGGTATVVNFVDWNTIMQFFNPPTPSATTITGSIASDGFFTPGTATGSFEMGTSIVVDNRLIGDLSYVDYSNPSLGMTLGRGGYYSGPIVFSGTTIKGFNGWTNLTPIASTNFVWSDLTTSSISYAQTNQPYHGGYLVLYTSAVVNSKNFPANVQTANYAPAP